MQARARRRGRVHATDAGRKYDLRGLRFITRAVLTGGVIANGTYVLLASRFHGACPPAEDDRITWNICGATWSTVQEITRFGAVTTQHIDGDVVASGAFVTFTASCPARGIPVTTLGFDAAESTLALYVYGYGPGTVRVDSFVRK